MTTELYESHNLVMRRVRERCQGGGLDSETLSQQNSTGASATSTTLEKAANKNPVPIPQSPCAQQSLERAFSHHPISVPLVNPQSQTKS